MQYLYDSVQYNFESLVSFKSEGVLCDYRDTLYNINEDWIKLV